MQIFDRTTVGLILGSWSVKVGEWVDVVNWNEALTIILLMVSILTAITNFIYKITHWKNGSNSKADNKNNS